ncbi:MAG: putative transcriptional regulatory protein pdtaR [Anaerolineales bacterium]|nr:putative transcriptional regulatory protein pdtaR [Anaerolineales bacterium]
MDRARIVIAEDEDLTRKDLKETLEGLGYLVVGEARDGQSAISLARELRPEIVVMDIQMPGMDGIDAAKTLTEERIAPTLLLTGYYDEAKIERAKEAGVIAYLVKPFSESDLEPAIQVALSRYDEFRQLDEKIEQLEDTLETRKLVDRAKGILMDSQELSESEAFRKIQKMSMDTRRPMKDIAQALIITQEAGN